MLLNLGHYPNLSNPPLPPSLPPSLPLQPGLLRLPQHLLHLCPPSLPPSLYSLGFCGCLSTYSTFALELHKLPTRQAWLYALATFGTTQVGREGGREGGREWNILHLSITDSRPLFPPPSLPPSLPLHT